MRQQSVQPRDSVTSSIRRSHAAVQVGKRLDSFFNYRRGLLIHNDSLANRCKFRVDFSFEIGGNRKNELRSFGGRHVDGRACRLAEKPARQANSSGGNGTPAHLVGEQFRLRTGVSVTHVPYRALPQAIGDLLNGTNHYQFITPLPVIELISSGKLRALAVTAPKRLATLPDVPTVVEAGFSELVTEDWLGFVVKSGTPDAIVSNLNQAVNKALAKPGVREAFAKIAAEPAGGTAAEFGTQIKAQLAHWAKVVKDAGIRPLE